MQSEHGVKTLLWSGWNFTQGCNRRVGTFQDVLLPCHVLCFQLWTMYCESYASFSTASDGVYNTAHTTIMDFWARVTPGVLQLLSHSKVVSSCIMHATSLFYFDPWAYRTLMGEEWCMTSIYTHLYVRFSHSLDASFNGAFIFRWLRWSTCISWGCLRLCRSVTPWCWPGWVLLLMLLSCKYILKGSHCTVTY